MTILSLVETIKFSFCITFITNSQAPSHKRSIFLLACRAINGTPSMNRTYTGRFRRPTTVSNGEGRKAPGSGSCPTQKPGLVDYSWLMTSSTTWYPSPDLNREAARHWFLRPACLPFHQTGIELFQMIYPRRNGLRTYLLTLGSRREPVHHTS